LEISAAAVRISTPPSVTETSAENCLLSAPIECSHAIVASVAGILPAESQQTIFQLIVDLKLRTHAPPTFVSDA
jgi:hypothetical protein